MSRKDFKTFKPIARELIIDIDMDDYSPVTWMMIIIIIILCMFTCRFVIVARVLISVPSVGSL